MMLQRVVIRHRHCTYILCKYKYLFSTFLFYICAERNDRKFATDLTSWLCVCAEQMRGKTKTAKKQKPVVISAVINK